MYHCTVVQGVASIESKYKWYWYQIIDRKSHKHQTSLITPSVINILHLPRNTTVVSVLYNRRSGSSISQVDIRYVLFASTCRLSFIINMWRVMDFPPIITAWKNKNCLKYDNEQWFWVSEYSFLLKLVRHLLVESRDNLKFPWLLVLKDLKENFYLLGWEKTNFSVKQPWVLANQN